MKRWSLKRQAEVENPRVDAFLADLAEVCRRHDLSIAHEDDQGAFVVEELSSNRLAWLESAHDATVPPASTAPLRIARTPGEAYGRCRAILKEAAWQLERDGVEHDRVLRFERLGGETGLMLDGQVVITTRIHALRGGEDGFDVAIEVAPGDRVAFNLDRLAEAAGRA